MKPSTRWMLVILLACGALVQAQLYTPPQPTQLSSSPLLKKVGIDQKMGAQVPLDLAFDDEAGQLVTLRQYFGKPVILALVYYQCPSLCNMVLNGLVRSVKGIPLTPGEDYEVVAVSFDPRETPEMARAKKETYMKEYNRPGTEKGWHFLTGDEAASKALAASVGFRFVYDTMTNQYAHGSGIMLLTPEGRTSRYFFGIDYPTRDVRLGLVEASNNRVSSAVDQVDPVLLPLRPGGRQIRPGDYERAAPRRTIDLRRIGHVHDRDAPARFSQSATRGHHEGKGGMTI